MRLAKILWSLGSVLINFTIIIYVFLISKAPVDLVERQIYINENWNTFSTHWKAEFLFMAMITVGAFYFANIFKSASWSIITIGQLILLAMYPIMLGGYRNTTPEIFSMSNQMAIVIFVFGNIIFLAGLLHLYFSDNYLKKWLKLSAIAIASVALIAFSASFIGLIDWKQALKIGPLVNILYLINAYYGLKLKMG